jgi:hypothetical protein
MEGWQRFLTKFAGWGADPSVEGYLALFHPNATLLHPGMPTPISGEAIRIFITRALENLPNYRLLPISWAHQDNRIFIEARQSTRIENRELVWPTMYCIELRDDRVLTGRAYYDPGIVQAALRFNFADLGLVAVQPDNV